jgi:hypothetical protein
MQILDLEHPNFPRQRYGAVAAKKDAEHNRFKAVERGDGVSVPASTSIHSTQIGFFRSLVICPRAEIRRALLGAVSRTHSLHLGVLMTAAVSCAALRRQPS